MAFALLKIGYFTYNLALSIPIEKSDTSRILFKIKKGETVKSIGERLEQENIIRSKYLFYLHVREANIGQNIQAGQFVLKKSQNILEIARILTKSDKGDLVVSIIEGWKIDDIDQKLSSLNLIKKGEFVACTVNCDISDYPFLKQASSLEGYLFPDTYFINPSDFSVETFMHILLDNFEKKIREMQKEPGEGLGKYRFDDVIIMASILEKEVRTDEDRSLVSGILWKRLANNWTLGADATLLYLKNDDNTITSKDIESDSPYNTRKNLGLPPTAISNPGLKSIASAFYPKESPYWFYLTEPKTGKVIYAVTNEEHNINKGKYL